MHADAPAQSCLAALLVADPRGHDIAPERRFLQLAQRADRGGDPAAREVVDAQVRTVALAAVAIQRVLDPALVVLGGGIGSRPDFALRVREEAEEIAAEPVRVEPSALGEAAGVIGAAHAARLHLKEHVDV
ncbi:MAG: ROK family protein [Gaiellaceae bacterium]